MEGGNPAALQRLLKKTFGLASLRPGQREVMERILAGRDTLAIMPTGAGKSLCYQLPGLQMRGTTVIVSPLISLMKDQADKLEALGIEAAAFNSALSEAEQEEAMTEIRRRMAEMVFTTPEHLADAEFLALLKKTPIDVFVVDEAHCISQWGHDFRPAFLDIRTALHELGEPTVLALTATATPAVADDIKAQLGRPAMGVVNVGLYRPNLHYEVKQVTNPEEKRMAVLAALRSQPGCGIIYCATVKAAEELHGFLCEQGEQALLYHGRLASKLRTEAQDAFMGGGARVMVATNAFGMGIDKADIRFVVHYQLTGTLEAYYQESGRAGRDGDDATCTLLYDHNDRRVQFFFMGGRYPKLEDVRAVHDETRRMASGGGRVTLKQLLERELPVPKTKARVVFHLLREAGVLGRSETDCEELEELAQRYRNRADADRSKLERITFYAQSALCRWKILLEYFGESEPWERCGHCDNCRREAVSEAAAARARPSEVEETYRSRAPTEGAPRLHAGQRVRVPKYGRGVVELVAGESIKVRFPNGEARDFLAAFVSVAARARTAEQGVSR